MLAQTRPSVTTAVTLYSNPASTTTIVKEIVVCNTDAGAALVSVYCDEDGSTYDDTNVLLKTFSVAAGTTILLSEKVGAFIALSLSTTTIGIKVDVVDKVVFTAFGAKIT